MLVVIKYIIELIYPLSIQALFYFFLNKSYMGVACKAGHHILNVKITKVLISVLTEVWANQLKVSYLIRGITYV